MFDGNVLDSVALSDGGEAGWACAGELNNERALINHKIAIAIPRMCF
jgi:hypothetical protein